MTLSMAIRDLQRSGIKRSRIESPGGCLKFRVYVGDEILPQLCGDYFINPES